MWVCVPLGGGRGPIGKMGERKGGLREGEVLNSSARQVPNRLDFRGGRVEPGHTMVWDVSISHQERELSGETAVGLLRNSEMGHGEYAGGSDWAGQIKVYWPRILNSEAEVGEPDLLARAVVAHCPDGTLGWKTAQIGVNEEDAKVGKGLKSTEDLSWRFPLLLLLFQTKCFDSQKILFLSCELLLSLPDSYCIGEPSPDSNYFDSNYFNPDNLIYKNISLLNNLEAGCDNLSCNR